MVALVNGEISVPEANAIVGMSSEVHKSLKLDWDQQRAYVASNVKLVKGKVVATDEQP